MQTRRPGLIMYFTVERPTFPYTRVKWGFLYFRDAAEKPPNDNAPLFVKFRLGRMPL